VVSCQVGGLRIGVIADGYLFWQWAVGRCGTVVWTWVRRDSKGWRHPSGTWVRKSEGEDWAVQIQELFYEAPPVDVILYECIAPRQSEAIWDCPTVKLVAWFGAKNRGRFDKVMELSEMLGLDSPYPERGPFPEEDTSGMRVACMMLMRSLERGKNASTIQYETMRGLRSHFSNFIHTVPNGVLLSMVSEDSRGRAFFSNSPTNGYWFGRFMQGCHRRMGDVWIPDRALTISELLHCLIILDEDWVTFEGDSGGRLQTALAGFSLTAGYSAALRGEELPRIDLGAIRKYWTEATGHQSEPHVPLVMTGRFKAVAGGVKEFFEPTVFVTASGIDNPNPKTNPSQLTSFLGAV
jgi:hypothetical protein